MKSVLLALTLATAAAFAPLAPASRAAGALAARKCDCCGSDPIQGNRFNCGDFDVCAPCASDPNLHEDWLKFSWTIHVNHVNDDSDISEPAPVAPAASAPAFSAQASAELAAQRAPRPEDYKTDGKIVINEGVTGRFTKYAPANADDYEDDKDYRAAVFAKVAEDNKERRLSGKAVGAAASWEYMKMLDGTPKPKSEGQGPKYTKY
ncbi:hypothetical protein M885DRAFT_543663 [Pelagophyceae sp. CCMP2097]|nr:hypothetical protein M885DRAFT_543663 [Pelagophyceae sp. CCMP2097]